jgi:23S rRNA pseudouridine1911/1915/1917 synthase
VATPSRALTVDDPDTGQRLDVFLAGRLSLSRAQVRRLLERGAVRIGGRPVGASAKGRRMQGGTTVEVLPFTAPEDARAVAIDKPAGVPVHPLKEGERGTLLSALVARRPEVHGIGEGGLRSGVVHRLDVFTSGVVLFATEAAAWERLRAAFRDHRIEKVYRALVLGVPPEEGEVEVGLAMARHRPARVRVVPPEERARSRGVRGASLSWRRLEVMGPAALLEVRPREGHLHQIRATLAHVGFPVAGDPVYGAPDDPCAAQRQMLHAARIAFGDLRAESPDPPDLAGLCARLRDGLR